MTILYDESNIYFQYVQELLVETLHANTTVKVNPLLLTTLNSIPLGTIQQYPVRIIFVMCPLKLSQHILCLSKYNGMIYDRYQWAFMGRTLEELVQPVNFTYKSERYDCSAGDMVNALEKAILLLLNHHTLAESSKVELVSKITYKQYLTEYERYREDYNKRASIIRNSTYTHWAASFYDAVWAWALVLDNLTKTSASFNISGSHYGNLDQTRMIVKQFYKISFQGASGKVSFSEDTGFIQRQIDLFQIINGSDKLFAIVSKDRVNNIFEPKFIPDTFPKIEVRSSKALAVFFSVVAGVQFTVIFSVHVTTAVYYKRQSVKANSIKLLHMSYCGSYIVAAGTFACTLYSAAAASISTDLRAIFCQFLWVWCLPIGFTLSLGPVAMRTWRIYRIFIHRFHPGPLISDPILIMGVLMMLLIDIIIAVFWTTLDKFNTEQIRKTEGKIVKFRTICTCEYHALWLSAIVFYKTGLLILVTVLSLLTRNIDNVRHQFFKTNTLRAIVYLMTILFILGFSIYYFFIFNFDFNFSPNHDFVTLLVTLNVFIFLFILYVFIPPLWPVLKPHLQKCGGSWH